MKALFILHCFCFSILLQSQNSIFEVARSGSLEEVQEIFKENPKIIDQVNDSGYTPLILASYRGNQEVAAFIAENTNNIDYLSPDGTALMAAVVKGNEFIAKKILENNADPNLVDRKNTTALHYAIMFGNVGMVELLIAAEARTTVKDASGNTAEDYASQLHNKAILELLKP